MKVMAGFLVFCAVLEFVLGAPVVGVITLAGGLILAAFSVEKELR